MISSCLWWILLTRAGHYHYFGRMVTSLHVVRDEDRPKGTWIGPFDTFSLLIMRLAIASDDGTLFPLICSFVHTHPRR